MEGLLEKFKFLPTLGAKVLDLVLGSDSLSAYFIGGGVRDIFLERPTEDIDILIVSDPKRGLDKVLDILRANFSGVELTQELTSYYTAKVKIWDGDMSEEFDLVFARREVFPFPGAKAEIYVGDLESDLMRRDFSVNALAICKDKSGTLALVDIVNGFLDLQSKHLRVLHRNSFRDDPIRILRGVRLSNRLGFSFEDKTLRYIKQSVVDKDMLSVSIGRRIFELGKFANEPDPFLLLNQIKDLGILEMVLSVSSIDVRSKDVFNKYINQIGPSLGFWAFVLFSLKAFSKELLVVLPLSKAERKVVFESIGIN